ncbi:MAG: hypothetical protein ACYTAN_15865, partial [Planctomycetota bacterium]
MTERSPGIDRSAKRFSARDQTLFLVFSTCVLSALVVFGCRAIYRSQKNQVLAEIAGRATGRVLYQRNALLFDLSEVVDDLAILTEQPSVKRFLDQSTAQSREEVQKQFLLFSRRRERYDQIRIIDATGMEVVRVNYNDGSPAVVPDNRLQSKKGRYYFEDTMTLEKGRVFVSPLDLNIEGGEIERPLKPMIRFGVVLFDSAGDKKGILLLNDPENRSMLLNPQGFWLESPRDEDEWGFMFGNDRTFARDCPQAWERILAAKTGSCVTPAGLFFFDTVYPLASDQVSTTGAAGAFEPSKGAVFAEDRFWKVVSFIPGEVIDARLSGRRHLMVGIAVLLVGMLAAGCFILARSRLRDEAL